MSEISDAIQANRLSSERSVMLAWTLPSRDRGRPSVKCLAFGDRIIKLNDYLLEQASQKYDGRSKRYDVRKGKSAFSHQTSNISQPSSFSHRTSRVPVYLQSVAALANQLLRSGTSIGAKQLLEQREENEACFDFPESWQKSTKLMLRRVTL